MIYPGGVKFSFYSDRFNNYDISKKKYFLLAVFKNTRIEIGWKNTHQLRYFVTVQRSEVQDFFTRPVY